MGEYGEEKRMLVTKHVFMGKNQNWERKNAQRLVNGVL